MIRKDLDLSLCRKELCSPLFKPNDDPEHFLVVDGIVELGGSEFARVKRKWCSNPLG